MTFNWVDYVLLAILLISVLGGLIRGGVREVISLIAWIAAFIIAGLFAKPVAVYFASSNSAASSASTSQISLFAFGASFVVLFLVTLIAGFLIGYFVNRVIESGGVSIINRFLGGAFGLLRGGLIDLLIIFVVQLSAFSQQDYWTQSTVVSAFQPTVEWLNKKVEPGLASLKSQVGKKLEDMTSGAGETILQQYQTKDKNKSQ